jgi:hypothetical protein
MNNEKPIARLNIMSDEERIKTNKNLMADSMKTVDETKTSIKHLRGRLSVTYWIMIGLSVMTFLMGMALLSVPIAAAFGGNINIFHSLTAAGLGILDIATVFLFRPVERIHELMGDMSQIILVLHNFQIQTNLRLLEMDVTNRESICQTAEHIEISAKNSCAMVQHYFENKEPVK